MFLKLTNLAQTVHFNLAVACPLGKRHCFMDAVASAIRTAGELRAYRPGEGRNQLVSGQAAAQIAGDNRPDPRPR